MQRGAPLSAPPWIATGVDAQADEEGNRPIEGLDRIRLLEDIKPSNRLPTLEEGVKTEKRFQAVEAQIEFAGQGACEEASGQEVDG